MKLDVLPAVDNIIFEQRETGITHTPFQLEQFIYHAIEQGNVQVLQAAINQYLNNGFVVGRLSENGIRQIKYWAVATIAVAIHYAILGGLDETDAFNLSDIYIRHVDEMTNMEECIIYLHNKALELAEKVKSSKLKRINSPIIQKCVHYIHIHLHERLRIEDIAKRMKVSRDYLLTLFKKEMGVSLHSYIIHEKLEESKTMLLQEKSYDKISYQLSFCSETHYITCFKREYGITPGEYKKAERI